jgi:GNAT superfamily N-acetyltransferase
MRVRVVEAADRPGVDAFLIEAHAAEVARRGELVDALTHPALLAEDEDGTLRGVATWMLHDDSIEVLTLHSAGQWSGAGTALLEAVAAVGRSHGMTRLWLVTTNDNVDALRFYQRRGLRLRELRAGAVDDARRTVKPAIPELGAYGIPIRDELELDLEI